MPPRRDPNLFDPTPADIAAAKPFDTLDPTQFIEFLSELGGPKTAKAAARLARDLRSAAEAPTMSPAPPGGAHERKVSTEVTRRLDRGENAFDRSVREVFSAFAMEPLELAMRAVGNLPQLAVPGAPSIFDPPEALTVSNAATRAMTQPDPDINAPGMGGAEFFGPGGAALAIGPLARAGKRLNLDSFTKRQSSTRGTSFADDIPPNVLSSPTNRSTPAERAQFLSEAEALSGGPITTSAFHGTFKDVPTGAEKFKFGGFHVGTKKAAIQRLEDTRGSARAGRPGGGKVVEFDVSLNKTLGTVEKPLSETDLMQLNVFEGTKELKAAGFDGIIYRNAKEDRGSVSIQILDFSKLKTKEQAIDSLAASFQTQFVSIEAAANEASRRATVSKKQATKDKWQAIADKLDEMLGDESPGI